MDILGLVIAFVIGLVIGMRLTGYFMWVQGGKKNYINREWVDRKENPLEKELDDFADEAGMERLSSEEKIEAARRFLLSTE